jgi:uncharacterized protein (TIGR01244 family)
MSRTRKLLTATALPLATGLGGVVAAHTTGLNPPALTRPAQAQANPCGPVNPCAVASPCAPAAATQAAQPATPCAARPAITGAAANPYDVPAGYTQAPYGDAMPDIVENYLRAAPYVGTGGVVDMRSFGQLAQLGFKTVINLNTSEEGATQEEGAARSAGLTYVSIPVSTRAPSDDEVAEFSKYVNDPAHYPILVHCISSNRVGAMWALYRAANAVPPEIAVQEGRTVGLKPSREGAVRERLGLPPLSSG